MVYTLLKKKSSSTLLGGKYGAMDWNEGVRLSRQICLSSPTPFLRKRWLA